MGKIGCEGTCQLEIVFEDFATKYNMSRRGNSRLFAKGQTLPAIS